MAKRTEERPFRPLDSSLVQAVMGGNTAPSHEEKAAPVQTVELVRPLATAPAEEPRPAPAEIRPVPVRATSMEPSPRPSARRITPSQASPTPLEEGLNREKRVLLTRSEERTLERVVANIAAELGASLKVSHVLRSCIRLIIDAEGEIVERARATGRTVRPPNGDLAAIEAFEKVIANVLQTAIRSSGPLR